jgi:alkylation response protein AidB-like acyl-CoA dehydrogenase
MNFGFSEEQDFFREEMRKFLQAQSPMEEVRRLMETPEGYSSQLWKQLGELGYLGLVLPADLGGAGLGWVDLVVLLEETGRALFPSPLISTALAGSVILDAGSDAQKRRWLPSIADGSRIGTLALLEASDLLAPGGISLRGAPDGDGFVLEGEKRFVVDAETADLLVVAFRTGDGEEELTLAVVDAEGPGFSVTGVPALDRTKRLGTLRFDGLRVGSDAVLGLPGAAWPTISRVIDRGAVAVSAEMVGAAEAALEITVRFAKDRHQFGSPIGRFQGVKHPLAEMYVDIESLKSLVYFAAWALDADPEKASPAASEAKAFGSLAFSRIGIAGVQLHGAVGYTLEYDIQLYLKRSKWSRPLFGDEDYHCDRIARLGGY